MKLAGKKIAIFGDSFTTGQNNNWNGLATYIADYSGCWSLDNRAISGTTLGEYSIYPVDGDNLLSKLKRSIAFIKEANLIILEFGINDAVSLMIQNVSFRQVLVTIAKVDDFIRQTNPKAEVVFLKLTNDKQLLRDYAYLQQRYLSEYYMKDLISKYEMDSWDKLYDMFIKAVEKRFKIVEMISNSPNFLLTKLDSDRIHPTDEGYREIAQNIVKQLEEM